MKRERVPLYVQDVERMRSGLKLTALDRVRLIIEASSPEVVEVDEEPGDGKLMIQMECVPCEELLKWDASRKWWVCPVCQSETTDIEIADLLRVSYHFLGQLMGSIETTDEATGKGEGEGRWTDRMLAWMVKR